MEERFAEGTTILHRMDAKPKIISALIFIIPAAITNSFPVAAGFLFLALLFATLSKLPLSSVLKRLVLVNTFTLFLLLTLPLTFGGEQFPLFPGFEISREGTRLALLITLKTNTILIATIALLSTSTIAALGHGLEKTGLPLRLCYLLLFTYRYIFVIEQEFGRLLRAAKMRCFVPSTTIHTYRTYGYLFGMTLVKSWDQAHRVHQAMILRGFNGRFIPLCNSGNFPLHGYTLILSVLLYSLSLIFWEKYFLFPTP